MLDYPILRKKQTINIVKDGEATMMIDLLSDVIKKEVPLRGKTIVVTKDYVARPDLVAFVSYGTDAYGDLVCKLNGISNPFELNEGMILFIPYIDSLQDIIKVSGTTSELVSPNSKTNSNGQDDNIFGEYFSSVLANGRMKQEKTDDTIVKDKRIPTIGKEMSTNKKLRNEKRSPAEQTIDDKNFTVDRSLGIVIY